MVLSGAQGRICFVHDEILRKLRMTLSGPWMIRCHKLGCRVCGRCYSEHVWCYPEHREGSLWMMRSFASSG